ncbi:hypothetical protein AAMO2058_001298000 [Amorphochlora amoebiformis]
MGARGVPSASQFDEKLLGGGHLTLPGDPGANFIENSIYEAKSPGAESTVSEILSKRGGSDLDTSSLMYEEIAHGYRVIAYGLPILVLSLSAVIGFAQQIRRGDSRLNLSDDEQQLLHSRVRTYSDVGDVRTTINARAYALGIMLAWASLVLPHMALATLLMAWIVPLQVRWRRRLLFGLTQIYKMVWAADLTTGVVVIAFRIQLQITLGVNNFTLDLFQTSSRESNIKVVCLILSTGLAQWMYYHHRLRISIEESKGMTDTFDQEKQSNNYWREEKYEEKGNCGRSPPLSPRLHGHVPLGWRTLPMGINEIAYAAAQADFRGKQLSRETSATLNEREWRKAIRFWGILSLALAGSALSVGAAFQPFSYAQLSGLAEGFAPIGKRQKPICLAHFPWDATELLGNSTQQEFTATLYAMLFIGFPTLSIVIAIVLWALPASVHTQRWLLRLVEITGVWSCLELWYIAGGIAMASYRILCAALLHDIKPCAILLGDTGVPCFSVKGVFSHHAWWMILAAIMHRMVLFLVTMWGQTVLDKGEGLGGRVVMVKFASTASTRS